MRDFNQKLIRKNHPSLKKQTGGTAEALPLDRFGRRQCKLPIRYIYCWYEWHRSLSIYLIL